MAITQLQPFNLNTTANYTFGNITTDNANIGNIGTAGLITATGNIGGANINTAGAVTASRLVSNVVTGTAPLTVTSTTRVNNLNVAYANVADTINVVAGTGNNFIIFANAATGNITELTSTGLTANLSNNSITATTFVGALSGAATSATTAGTVTTAAQPNITSVGTLTGLTLAANADITMSGTDSNINGVNLVSATLFAGSGANLTTLNASNVSSGTLAQARLANASVTLGSTALTLGSTVTTVAGLSSVTSTTFVGALTGSATSATTAGTVTTNAQPNITSVGTLTGLTIGNATANTVFGNGTITLNSGLITGNGAGLSQIAGANVTGTVANATFATSAGTAGTVTTAAQPNITSVGTLTGLTLSGTLSGAVQIGTGAATHFGTTLTTGANTTTGTITGNWSLSAGSRFNATYADLAERYVADLPYEPGTVLAFGGAFEVSITGEADSTRVAGVVSTNPAYLMNSECEGEHVVDLALIGRVPVRVQGPVNKGDLLVTSEISGFAKANNEARAGTIIGKALENFNGLTSGGLIEILVGRS